MYNGMSSGRAASRLRQSLQDPVKDLIGQYQAGAFKDGTDLKIENGDLAIENGDLAIEEQTTPATPEELVRRVVDLIADAVSDLIEENNRQVERDFERRIKNLTRGL